VEQVVEALGVELVAVNWGVGMLVAYPIAYRWPQGVNVDKIIFAPVGCCWDCHEVHPFAHSPVGHLGDRRGDHCEVPLDIRMRDVNFYSVQGPHCIYEHIGICMPRILSQVGYNEDKEASACCDPTARYDC
jgi:hypothetical protein